MSYNLTIISMDRILYKTDLILFPKDASQLASADYRF